MAKKINKAQPNPMSAPFAPKAAKACVGCAKMPGGQKCAKCSGGAMGVKKIMSGNTAGIEKVLGNNGANRVKKGKK